MSDEQQSAADGAPQTVPLLGHEFFMKKNKLNLGSKAPPKHNTEFEAQLKEANQNFDEEEVVASLEDPGLISHMTEARDNYASNLADTKSKRKISSITNDLYGALGALSNFVKDFRQSGQDIGTVSSELEIVGRHQCKLLEGRAVMPHYETPLPRQLYESDDLAKVFKTTKKLLDKNSAKTQELENDMKKHRQVASNVRVSIVQYIDELVELCKSQQSTIEAQEQVLKMFNPTLYKNELKEQEEFIKFKESMKSARDAVAKDALAKESAEKNETPSGTQNEPESDAKE